MSVTVPDDMTCSSGAGCNIGRLTIRVADDHNTLEREFKEHKDYVSETVKEIFAQIRQIVWWIISVLIAVILMGGGAILAFTLRK